MMQPMDLKIPGHSSNFSSYLDMIESRSLKDCDIVSTLYTLYDIYLFVFMFSLHSSKYLAFASHPVLHMCLVCFGIFIGLSESCMTAHMNYHRICKEI